MPLNDRRSHEFLQAHVVKSSRYSASRCTHATTPHKSTIGPLHYFQGTAMTTDTRVIIVHGSYGNPMENWFPWLRDQLTHLGATVLTPSFPTPEGQNLANWLKVFDDEVGPLTSRDILVGHSLGPAFILHLLQRSQVPVMGTFLVSGFLNDLGIEEFDSVNSTFTADLFDWPVVRANSGHAHVYNSNNDPYVPLTKGTELAEKLGVSLIVLDGAGHVNASAGFTTFPLLLQDISALMSAA